MATCEYCKAQFDSTFDLEQHKANHHAFVCLSCKRKFGSNFELSQHRIKEHPELLKRTYGNPLGIPAIPPKPSTKMKTLEEFGEMKDPSLYFVEMFDPNC